MTGTVFRPRRAAVRLVLGMVCAGGGVAWGSSPAEKVVCTQAPRSAWISEARVRAAFGTEDFSLVKFKVSRGNCYEFYAIARDGSVVEAYYDPTTGERVRYNRVAVQRTETPRYESSRTR